MSSLSNTISKLPKVEECFDLKLKSLSDCDQLTFEVDQAARMLADVRLAIAENKAMLANKFIEENLMTLDECAKIKDELSRHVFHDLSAESCFYSWLKKFQDKFFDGKQSVNLVKARINARFDSKWRDTLELRFANDSSPYLLVNVEVPLPNSIHPHLASQNVIGGVMVSISRAKTIHFRTVFIFEDEYDLCKVKQALSSTLCIGKTEDLQNFKADIVRQLFNAQCSYQDDFTRMRWFESFFPFFDDLSPGFHHVDTKPGFYHVDTKVDGHYYY